MATAINKNSQESTLLRVARWLVPLQDLIEMQTDSARRRLFISVLILSAMPVLGLFAFIEYQNAQWLPFRIIVSAITILSCAFYFIRMGIAELSASRVAFAYISFAIIFICFLGRTSHEVFYLLLIPAVAVFSFGILEGTLWSSLVLAIVTMLMHPFFGLDTDLIKVVSVDFYTAYIVAFIFAIVYELIRSKTQALAEKRATDLASEKERLTTVSDELADQEKRLQEYADLASDWLMATDTDLKMTFISSRFEEVTGINRDSLLGENLIEMLDVDDVGLTEELRARIANRESFKAYRYQIKTAGKGLITVITSGKPTYDSKGGFQGYISASTNVTDYEKVQAEINAKERTLQQMQKLEAVGQLTSGISHDYNNLMTVIKGNLELIRMSMTDEKDLELLDSINDAANSAAQLNAKLLSFSRQSQFELHRVNVNEFLQGFGLLIRRTIGDRIELDILTGDEELHCQIDTAQFESAVLNLAINARDAMQEKGLLTITSKKMAIANDLTLADGDYVKISVIDEGVGITPDMIPLVTEPFFTTKPEGKGTGLGLSMVKEFIQKFDGKLEIQSAPGIGTSVDMYVPLIASEDPSADRPAKKDLPRIPPARILIVEDEPSVQTIVSRMLGLLDHSTDICNTAEHALELLKDNEYDFLITDLMLGSGMNGSKLANLATEAHPSMKIVMMSGYPEKILGQEIDESFKFKLLRKPFSIEELATGLAEVAD